MSNDEPKPGDRITFGLDGIRYSRPSDYGHVEIARGMPAMRYFFVSGRGHGKRAFLARLTGSVRGRK